MEPTKGLAGIVYEQVGQSVLTEGKINIGAMNKVVQAIQQQKGFENYGSTEAIGALAASLIEESSKTVKKNEDLGNFAKGICNMELAEALPLSIRAKLKIASQQLNSGEKISAFKQFTTYCSEALISMGRFFTGRAMTQNVIWKYASTIEQAQDQKKVTDELKKLLEDCKQKKLPKNFADFVEKLATETTTAEGVSQAAFESWAAAKKSADAAAELKVKDLAAEKDSADAAYKYILSLGDEKTLQIAAFITVAIRNACDDSNPVLRDQCITMMVGFLHEIPESDPDRIGVMIQAAAENKGEDKQPLLGQVAQNWWKGVETFGLERKKPEDITETGLQTEVQKLENVHNYRDLRNISTQAARQAKIEEQIKGKTDEQKKAYFLDLIADGCLDPKPGSGKERKLIIEEGCKYLSEANLTNDEIKYIIYFLVRDSATTTWDEVKKQAGELRLSGTKVTLVGAALNQIIGEKESSRSFLVMKELLSS